MSAAPLRRIVAGALARTPLIVPAVRVREYLRALSAPEGAGADSAGRPLPNRFLRLRAIGTADADQFLISGRQSVEYFEALLNRDGSGFAEAGAVLDFGCGCGRLSRHLPDFTTAAIHGRDINARAARWCAAHLAGDFRACGLTPPLDLPDSGIDIGFALSVLTHLDASVQRAWLAEWARVLRPGGRFIATYHDAAHPGAWPETAARLEREGLVVQSAGYEGSNHFATFQTPAATAEMAAEWFDAAPEAPDLTPPFPQTALLLRKRA